MVNLWRFNTKREIYSGSACPSSSLLLIPSHWIISITLYLNLFSFFLYLNLIPKLHCSHMCNRLFSTSKPSKLMSVGQSPRKNSHITKYSLHPILSFSITFQSKLRSFCIISSNLQLALSSYGHTSTKTFLNESQKLFSIKKLTTVLFKLYFHTKNCSMNSQCSMLLICKSQLNNKLNSFLSQITV